MTNLAAIVTKDAIYEALEEAYSKKLRLIPSTRYHIFYKNERFPPKEIVRLAAQKMDIKNVSAYRLKGGESTNRHLKNKGFILDQFTNRAVSYSNNETSVNEEKISRLTYNTNGWIYPSGREGKSKTNNYESDNGYGHEEWLLDFTKIIEDFKYGYLEPINKNFKKYLGKTFNIFLYTIDSNTKEKFWIGKLNNVEVIDEKMAEEIKTIYKDKGWYQEMKQDLEKLKLINDHLDKWKGASLFNVRFKKRDYEKFPERTLISSEDNSVSAYYYVLLNISNEPKIITDADGKFILGRCNPNGRSEATTLTKKFEEKSVQYPFIHHQISRALEETLKKDFDEVYAENKTGFKTCIDLVARKGKKINFYEIKTYNDVRTCIRQAIGQLLEYSYFPNRKNADEIFIVTPHEIVDSNMIEYIKNLRKNVGLPINYIFYDLKNKRISQTI